MYLARNEDVAKFLIRNTFYLNKQPSDRFYDQYMNAEMRARCTEYWHQCIYQLDQSGLSQLLKAKSLDEQIIMWCADENLRDNCGESKLRKDGYPDLVDAVTNVVNRIRKEIFLRNNDYWKDFINKNLPLGEIQKDLRQEIEYILHGLYIVDVGTAEESVIEITGSPRQKQTKYGSPQVSPRVEEQLEQLLNTDVILSPGKMQDQEVFKLAEKTHDALCKKYKKEKASREIEQSSSSVKALHNVLSEEKKAETGRKKGPSSSLIKALRNVLEERKTGRKKEPSSSLTEASTTQSSEGPSCSYKK